MAAATNGAGLNIANQITPPPVNLARVMKTDTPGWIDEIHRQYRSRVAHSFIVHGNVNDYMDDTGLQSDVHSSLACAFDSAVQDKFFSASGQRAPRSASGRKSVFATFGPSKGLHFASPESQQEWERIMVAVYDQEIKANDNILSQLWEQYQANAAGMRPMALNDTLGLLNMWFRSASRLRTTNLTRQSAKPSLPMVAEINFTIAFSDADLYWPSNATAENRDAIGYLRAWARDTQIGQRNRIILLTRHLSEIESSVKGGDAGVCSVLIPRPSLEQREAWLVNFNKSLEERAQSGTPFTVDGRAVGAIRLESDFDLRAFAVNSAGMSRRQLEYTVMSAEVKNEPTGMDLVKAVKQTAIRDEFGGLVDFVEPTYGFNAIGGHEGVKRYFMRAVRKLRSGEKRGCPRSALLIGPPGTGKSQIALALAYESKMNYLKADFSQLFGGIVGETERKTKQFLEFVDAAAPCIVFIDELESALGAGRVTSGDSNTGGRMFSSILQWLSSDRLVGRVFVVAATNRPDMLDAALIRDGRFDAKIPCLPPGPGDAVGRTQILKALTGKHSVRFEKDLQETMDSKDTGLGRLLNDERVWTGAEIEVILKEASENADDNGRRVISREDWDQAMEDVIPNTGDVEAMTNMALYYANNRKYCPAEWRDRMGNRSELKRCFADYVSGTQQMDERD